MIDILSIAMVACTLLLAAANRAGIRDLADRLDRVEGAIRQEGPPAAQATAARAQRKGINPRPIPLKL